MSEHRWVDLDRESFSKIRTFGGEMSSMVYEDGMAQCAGCGCISAQKPHGFMLSHDLELIEIAENNQDCFEIVVVEGLKDDQENDAM